MQIFMIESLIRLTTLRPVLFVVGVMSTISKGAVIKYRTKGGGGGGGARRFCTAKFLEKYSGPNILAYNGIVILYLQGVVVESGGIK